MLTRCSAQSNVLRFCLTKGTTTLFAWLSILRPTRPRFLAILLKSATLKKFLISIRLKAYTRAKYEEMIAYARSVMPSMVLTSDVIIGFPGETEDEAMQTVDLVEKTQFDALFTFIFSPRPGTPAAKMDDPVSREEKQVWFEKLVDAQNAISAKKHAAYIGRTVKVLVDGESDDEAFPLAARTEGNRLVRMKGERALIGTFAKAKITDSNTWALYGEAVEE